MNKPKRLPYSSPWLRIPWFNIICSFSYWSNSVWGPGLFSGPGNIVMKVCYLQKSSMKRRRLKRYMFSYSLVVQTNNYRRSKFGWRFKIARTRVWRTRQNWSTKEGKRWFELIKLIAWIICFFYTQQNNISKGITKIYTFRQDFCMTTHFIMHTA